MVNLCIADYLYFRALSITSASSGLFIFNISSVVTYFLSLFVLNELFSWVKLAGVFTTFGGAALIAFSDKIKVNETRDLGLNNFAESYQNLASALPDWQGDLVMAGGAVFWGMYLVFYKKFIGEPSYTTINIQCFSRVYEFRVSLACVHYFALCWG